MMKRSLVSCCFFFTICFFACNDGHLQRSNREWENDFIYLKDNHFCCNDTVFFPMMLNYVVSFQSDENGNFILAPHIDYDSVNYVEAEGEEEVARQIEGHLQLIKELGFNTLRVCFDRISFDDSRHPFYHTEKKDFYLKQRSDRNAILRGVEKFLKLSEEKGLRVMLLIKPPVDNDDLIKFTNDLLSRFRNCPTLFAYDFMNEPLYFDGEPDRTKISALNIVRKWAQLMDQYAPNQLFTIGFSEPIEVFEWDASLLPVDFVEIHTYHPLRIPCEIYWYSKYIDKPWMIGETGLPADGDSISYKQQSDLFEAAYNYTRNAGGCGFGWWEFQELSNFHFEAKYTGLLNHTGETSTADGKYVIQGSLKISPQEMADIVRNYHPEPLSRPVNYYNMVGYQNIAIRGTIVDDATHTPVEGAVIRGWNGDWSIGMNTYSDPDGNFILRCNAPCSHFEISAAHKSKIKFDRQLSYYNIHRHKSDVSNLPNSTLEYQRISFQPFFKHNPSNIFDFDGKLFFNADYYADLDTIKLKTIQ